MGNTGSSFYTCPMHPEVHQDGPGSCPKCGMDLELQGGGPLLERSESSLMNQRLFFAILFTACVVFLSMGGMLPTSWNRILQLVLTIPVVFWSASPLFQKGVQSIRNFSFNMFTLISLGISVSFAYSAVAVLFPSLFPDSLKEQGFVPIYFETASVITVLVLVGQVLELRARSKTNSAVRLLLSRSPKNAHVVLEGQEKETMLSDVHVGDILRVKPGEKVPVDGTVIDGYSYVDESMMTGEAVPKEKKIGDTILGGTINQAGTLLMRAERVGSQTLLSRIVQMVETAQRSRAPIQQIADLVSGYFVPIVVIAAIITFAAWLMLGPTPALGYAIINAVSVLMIACPCALGLATPLSITVGMGRGTEEGVFFKNAESLETLGKIDTIIFDKTGTITEGKPRVTGVVSSYGPDLLHFAASLEQRSEHPLAVAIVQEAKRLNVPIHEVENFTSFPGKGVVGRVENHQICVGSIKFLQEYGVNPFYLNPNSSSRTGIQGVDDFQNDLETVVGVAIDHQMAGKIFVSDSVRESAFFAVDELHRLGLNVIMLSGDNEKLVNKVAKSLHIDEYHAEVYPSFKHDFVKVLREKGKKVAMAGDGVNDAPALAVADVGIAMGSGSDVAIETAPITLMKGDVMGIVRALLLSRATMTNIRQNLFLAFIYNIVAIPIAAGVFYPFTGLLLHPIMAAAAMTLSSLSVIANALRLKRSRA